MEITNENLQTEVNNYNKIIMAQQELQRQVQQLETDRCVQFGRVRLMEELLKETPAAPEVEAAPDEVDEASGA